MATNPIYALTQRDVQYLGNAPAASGGFITAWGELDNALALPCLVNVITGRPFLGTQPGLDIPLVVPQRDIDQILRASSAQNLQHISPDLLPALLARREEWHKIIRGQA